MWFFLTEIWDFHTDEHEKVNWFLLAPIGSYWFAHMKH